ncbi:MAG: dihydrodipicolinate reductase [Conexivisphaerales archaeon]|jgi:4-hydroxy-tetrahydrodipicolinate reductase
MKSQVNAISFGVGAIGSMVAKAILEKKDWIRIVGAVDVDSGKVGRDLGEAVGLGRPVGVKISGEVDEALEGREADVAIHTTSSSFSKVYPEVEQLVRRGLDVVSSCEELSFPYLLNEGLAKKLDAVAKEHGVTVLGTGINPGFLMDALPLVLTAPCVEVRRVKVVRKLNAGSRRVPFQKKVGAGMAPEEFKEALRTGRISGHVGLGESISMIAAGLGWKLDELRLGEVEPVLLDRAVRSNGVEVPLGKVAGLRQAAQGMMEGEAVIEHEFVAYVGAEEEFDLVEVDGLPSVRSKITPCVHGDYGTVAMLINMIPRVLEAKPGLCTMKDLPLPSAVL